MSHLKEIVYRDFYMTTIKQVSPKELNKWIESNTAVVVDVREVIEYNEKHIKQATNLPLSEVSLKHKNMPEHKGKKLVFHCKTGRRSTMACEKILAEGCEFEVWNLAGGIEAWSSDNLPIESLAKVISINRQVMITAGSIVLLGMLLGSLIHQGYYLLSTFVGAGLVFAGATGNCYMEKLLLKMPWNK